MIVVTAGRNYLDIDAYAGIIAYSELLIKQGIDAVAASSAPLNVSITPSLRTITTELQRDYVPNQNDTFVIVDVADPEAIDSIVDQTRITTIMDHHSDCERFWKNTPVNVQIERIGAACTLVFEHWEAAKLEHELSEGAIRLLMAGILDNTLNFRAHITTNRDRSAYGKLQALLRDSGGFTDQYFSECQVEIEKDVIGALKNDSKLMTYPIIGQIYVGQLALWDTDFLRMNDLGSLSDDMPEGLWFINIIDISAGHSYFLAKDDAVKDFLLNVTKVSFEKDLAKADRLWLRKEIMQAAHDMNEEIT